MDYWKHKNRTIKSIVNATRAKTVILQKHATTKSYICCQKSFPSSWSFLMAFLQLERVDLHLSEKTSNGTWMVHRSTISCWASSSVPAHPVLIWSAAHTQLAHVKQPPAQSGLFLVSKGMKLVLQRLQSYLIL